MKKYKDVWITRIEYGKFLVRTKVGLNYIADPPNALDEAIARAKEIRKGQKPIRLITYPDGKYSQEVVA